MMTPHIEVAKSLFLWNSKNLVRSATIKKSDLNLFFADRFHVFANGKHYDADHDSYLEFLNQFKSTINSINYKLHPIIEDTHHVVIPMTAHIIRINHTIEDFEAILILKFDSQHKITLWHEVYIKM